MRIPSVIMKILLDKIMEDNMMTYSRLEKLSGISKSTLHRIANQRTSPTMNHMERIAKAMDIHISDLYDSEYK